MTISSFSSSQNLATDTWLKASWEDFLALAMNAAHEQGRFYYDEGYLRVEMAPVGPVHGRDNAITAKVISLYAALNNIPIQEFTNTSFRRTGLQECQPDSAFYIGSEVRVPSQSNAPVELGGIDGIDAPSLIVEIAASSLDDDLGRKRLLYEQ
jgi:Uma2 family endonuclease